MVSSGTGHTLENREACKTVTLHSQVAVNSHDWPVRLVKISRSRHLDVSRMESRDDDDPTLLMKRRQCSSGTTSGANLGRSRGT